MAMLQRQEIFCVNLSVIVTFLLGSLLFWNFSMEILILEITIVPNV